LLISVKWLKNYPFLKDEKGVDFLKEEKKLYVEIFDTLWKNDYE